MRYIISPTPAGEFGEIALSASHASIGDQLTITGSGFGSSQGTSTVWFGELPQYTFSDDVVARPCAREAASYVSWSDTQVVVTVPSMAPGLSGATGTYHNVYVDFGATQTETASFYIDPATTLDASSSEAAWAAVFPNSVVTVEDITYTNSSGADASKHASYTTHVTLDATNGARPWGANYVAANSYNILIKDVTFKTDVGDNVISPNDAGVVTLGEIAAPTEGGYWGAANQYNLTFHNCVVCNNLSVYSDGQGMNGIKAFHASDSGTDRHGDWTFSDCSIGTPNSPTGCFRRMGIELVEYTGGFAEYTETNHLNRIAFVGCDFEPPGVMPYSFAVYGRGPDRDLLIDDCLMKGSGPGNVGWGSSCIEYSGYGLTVKDTDIWSTRSGGFSWEGDGDGTGGLSMAGYQCHRLCKNVTFDMTHQYHSVAAIDDHWMLDASTELDYAVFDNCDFNVGNATNHIRAMHYATEWSECHNWDMSTSYIHGTAHDMGSTGDGIDYWRNTWNASDPVTTYGYNSETNTDANGNVYPQVGTRP